MAKGRRLPSVMKNRFSTVPSANIRRSSFDRSHAYKTTFNVDWLVPVFVDEVYPSDTFSLTSTHLCRLTTLVQPIMDNLRLDLQFFYVPNRLLWKGSGDPENSGWQAFITGGDQPVAWTGNNPSEKLFVPQAFAPTGGYAEQSIYDYFGLPTKVANYRHSVLPLRAYNLIWNEYYRDENLQESLPVWTGDSDPKVDPNTGEESTADNAVPYQYKLMKRNKRYDYFTSCLPGLQKGPQVGIGIAGGDSGRLPVHGLAIPQAGSSTIYNPSLELGSSEIRMWGATTVDGQSVPNYYGVDGPMTAGSVSATQGNWYINNAPVSYYQGVPVAHTPTSGSTLYTTPKIDSQNFPIYVDLGAASSVTINALRNAITLQQWLEKNARYGTRYIEHIQGHFGVHAQDYRLQRPEYLGGLKTYISINPTVQTSSTDSTSPQANLAAYALSTDSKHLFTKSFVEHGWIIGLASVTADLTYQQGLDRMWSRFSKYDYYFPSWAHLGEQPVFNKELYTQSDDVLDSNGSGASVNDLPFGYQERWAELRYKPSKITGLFRSTAQGTLDSWHLSQKFENLPTLNKTFIESNTPIDRALAVPSQPDLLCDFFFSLKCVRPLPVYSVPGLRRL
ncbi:putative VP1 [Microviridae sp.]|nr:putative VP1 [Microviridae sp.]WNN13183.1 MAG: major capsid protein [Microviridae sp.]